MNRFLELWRESVDSYELPDLLFRMKRLQRMEIPKSPMRACASGDDLRLTYRVEAREMSA